MNLSKSSYEDLTKFLQNPYVTKVLQSSYKALTKFKKVIKKGFKSTSEVLTKFFKIFYKVL